MLHISSRTESKFELINKIREKQIEKSLWVTLKFGLPFLIIWIILVSKGIVGNYIDHYNDEKVFFEILVEEFITFSNHSIIICIIGLFEIIPNFLFERKKSFEIDKLDIIYNIAYILVATFLLFFSEIKMTKSIGEPIFLWDPQCLIVLHYILQTLFSIGIFVKLIYYDLNKTK